jgi:hypothetical protein
MTGRNEGLLIRRKEFVSINLKSGILSTALCLGFLASSTFAATVINQSYSGSFPATITGTLPDQATVLEEAFTVSSTSNLIASTTSYATGGFEPNMVLYNPDGTFNSITVTPGTSPVAATDSTGNAFDAYISAMGLTPGTYTLALMDWQVGQSITATNLSDGFTYNSGNGVSFVDEMQNLRTGNYSLSIALTPMGTGPTSTPEPATLLLSAPLLLAVVLLARKRRSLAS